MPVEVFYEFLRSFDWEYVLTVLTFWRGSDIFRQIVTELFQFVS